jgi:hypothetical protein
MKHLNAKLLFFLLQALTIVACTKKEIFPVQPQEITSHPAATFALTQLSPDEYRNYSWKQLRTVEYRDSILG